MQRAGYYTIPRYSEIVKMLDSEGNCNVENFTIGRENYGNIFFPGVTNVAGLNLDEIVFIRNKEVIVYPDERGLLVGIYIQTYKVFPLPTLK